jgi:hypothetical protein
MARKGLLRTDQVADQTTQRNFDRVSDAVETLARDHDVISSPVTVLVGTAAIPPGVSVAVYVGGASQTLTLPPANALGTSVASVLMLLNTSANTVTVVPSRGDSVNGTTSLSVATAVLALLVSDGVSKWLRNV